MKSRASCTRENGSNKSGAEEEANGEEEEEEEKEEVELKVLIQYTEGSLAWQQGDPIYPSGSLNVQQLFSQLSLLKIQRPRLAPIVSTILRLVSTSWNCCYF